MLTVKKSRSSAKKIPSGVRTAQFEISISTGDTALIVAALADMAKAYGVTRLALETGMSPDYLDQLMSPESDPKFSAIVTLVKALGLTLHVRNRQWHDNRIY